MGVVGGGDPDAVPEATAATGDDGAPDGQSPLGRSASSVLPLLDGEELAFLERLNDYRASQGKARLRVSIALCRSASFHSHDMAATLHYDHDSSDGTSFDTRLSRYYPYYAWTGENIVGGDSTGESAFTAWKGSPHHDANMLDPDFTVIGISRALGTDGLWYWTTDFGGYTDAVLSAGFGTIASNGGFESSSVATGVSWSSVRARNKWHLYASSTGACARRTGSAYNGSYGLRITDPDPGTAHATQLLLAAPGVTYTVKAFGRRAAGPGPQLAFLDFLDAGYKRLLVRTVPAAASTAWRDVAVSEVAPAGTRYVRVLLYGGGAAGAKSTLDWDDVRLEAF